MTHLATAPSTYSQWLSYPILQNPLSAWLMALLVVALGFFGGRIARDILVSRLRHLDRFTKRLGPLPANLLADLRSWCIFAAALYAGGRILALPSAIDSALRLIFIVAVSLQVLITSRIVVDHVILLILNRARRETGEPDPSIASASQIIRFMAMLVLVAIIVLLALANLGVEITPLLTGLGIGGIAVALAAQSILGDLFGSLTILFDKPFLVGDFIIVGNQLGTVEAIGVKTTRVRALSGELLIFTNSDLLNSRIQNFKRMQQRRVVFTLSVVFETPTDIVERIPGMLRRAVEARKERVRFDRAHFKAVGSYSFDFEVVYYVLSADYNVYMDIQQDIYFDIIRAFRAEKIRFAYPTTIEVLRSELQGPNPLIQSAPIGYPPPDERPERPQP